MITNTIYSYTTNLKSGIVFCIDDIIRMWNLYIPYRYSTTYVEQSSLIKCTIKCTWHWAHGVVCAISHRKAEHV